jgi:hypothetical protein
MQGSLTIRAIDGDIGRLNQFYFDDQQWMIRHLVIDISSSSARRYVLVDPVTINTINWPMKIIALKLTKHEVENSPDVDQHKPVSRQHEREYFNYYGLPYCWSNAGLWGSFGYQPGPLMMGRAIEAAQERDLQLERADPYLRSSREVIGYHIKALDGEVGHVEDFIINDGCWTIEQLVVDTRNWWHGKNVLLSPNKIARINWAEANVDVRLTKKQIKNSAEFDNSLLTPLRSTAIGKSGLF